MPHRVAGAGHHRHVVSPPAPAHCLVGTIAHSTEPAEAAKLQIVGDAETLDFEQLLALRPTVVVVAVDVVQRVRIDRIKALGIPVYQVHVTRLAGMPESLRRLGELTGTQETANRKADELRRGARRARRAVPRPRADPRAVPDLGSAYLHDRRQARDHRRAAAVRRHQHIRRPRSTAAPAVTREAAVLRDPELILASAPPGASADWLAEWRRYPAMAAVRNGALVSYVDERIDRMGPSVIDATANLCAVIDGARAARSAAGSR